MLHFEKFEKSYGSYLALYIKELSIEPGIYWVKGTNGSGKSTLLKAIAGTLSFDGDILLNKRISIKKQAVTYRRSVNFAEAEPIFPEFLTGQELINVFGSAKNAPKGQQEYLIQDMKKQSYIKQPIRTYSSGMLKKLSVVLAFMGNPELILLDEPLITLDIESINVLYKWITEKNQQNGTSFLLSSHQTLEYGELPPAKEILVQMQTLTLNN